MKNSIKDGFAKLFKNVKTIAVTCMQFGDTGKGKIVDLLADWAKYIARGTGGDNAGHTTVVDGVKRIFHLIPSGIIYDKEGKFNIMGTGMVVYPKTLCYELSLLAKGGLAYNNLMLSLNAKLILPTQILQDNIQEYLTGNKGKIGTTGKGIGPAYSDYVGRHGLVINDLLNEDVFVRKLIKHLRFKKAFFANCDPSVLKEAMNRPHLENGAYYDQREIFSLDAIVEKYMAYGKMLKPIIRETDIFLQKVVGKENILCEGAQGLLLSLKYGTYPFVTSSDSSVYGLVEGVGLNRSSIDLSLGIMKGYYMTRVGEGPFPTELGGRDSAEWCSGTTRKEEERLYGVDISVNDVNEFKQGVALRRVGDEFGATTGRPRRIGWLDLPLLRHAVEINGPDVILTKLDVLNDVEEIKICDHYIYTGQDYYYGRDTLYKKNDKITKTLVTPEFLQHCQPHYETFPGWCEILAGIDNYGDLPDNLRTILNYIKKEAGIDPKIISVGAEREETIFV